MSLLRSDRVFSTSVCFPPLSLLLLLFSVVAFILPPPPTLSSKEKEAFVGFTKCGEEETR